ncbi:hypothetical protein RUM43_000376 [Polyplax serrata]|uniref:Uncharacterized protein n=1 Tax=Polyplax serrata TaxID=468196 RepID=A0AAN8XNG7_POLSC
MRTVVKTGQTIKTILFERKRTDNALPYEKCMKDKQNWSTVEATQEVDCMQCIYCVIKFGHSKECVRQFKFSKANLFFISSLLVMQQLFSCEAFNENVLTASSLVCRDIHQLNVDVFSVKSKRTVESGAVRVDEAWDTNTQTFQVCLPRALVAPRRQVPRHLVVQWNSSGSFPRLICCGNTRRCVETVHRDRCLTNPIKEITEKKSERQTAIGNSLVLCANEWTKLDGSKPSSFREVTGSPSQYSIRGLTLSKSRFLPSVRQIGSNKVSRKYKTLTTAAGGEIVELTIKNKRSIRVVPA